MNNLVILIFPYGQARAYIRLWSKHVVMCFYQVLVVLSLFGTEETGCALASTFELLWIIGMEKKEKKKILLHLVKVGDS